MVTHSRRDTRIRRGDSALPQGQGHRCDGSRWRSVAFAALVRVIVAALPDPIDPTRYLLAVSKNNLVKKDDRPALAYELVPSDSDPDIGRVAWGQTVALSANEILAAQVEADKNNSGKVADAKQFLERFLVSGEWTPTKEILNTAKEKHGLSEAALRRAKEAMPRVIAEKQKEAWGWRLTEEPSEVSSSPFLEHLEYVDDVVVVEDLEHVDHVDKVSKMSKAGKKGKISQEGQG
jgi:hypothetical protein